MKKLTVSIDSLGSADSGDYVSFNIWQGKRLLLSDRIEGRHIGTFYRGYDVDYIQGEPLRIESNAPAGCSVGVNVTQSDDAVVDTNAFAVFKGVLDIKDSQIFMREAFIDKAWLRSVTPDSKVQPENYAPGESGFLIDYGTGKAEFNGKIVIHKPSGEPACVMGFLGEDSKTLEQRIAELEKQLADMGADSRNDTISPSDAASVMEMVLAETDKIIREKNMIGFSADISFMTNTKLNSEYVFIADQITPDDDDVKVNVRITGRQTPDLSLFWVPVLVDKVDGASLEYYEDQGVRAAKKMITDISQVAVL